jgi:hypothetical protein
MPGPRTFALTKRFALIAAALTAVPLAAAASSSAAPAAPAYHWTTLPLAPIHPRGDAAGVWTGSQLLVWGGRSGQSHYFANGASYIPSTKTWTTLPHAPLTGRSNPASVWTGSVWFVWGGTAGKSGKQRLTDGAVYDPATKTWTPLPSAPVSRYRDAQAFLVGSDVVLVSTSEAASARTLRADLYDPGTNTWSDLPSLRLTAKHANVFFSGVAGVNSVYLQSDWSYDVEHRHGGTIHSGVDGYTLDPTAEPAHVWTPNTIAPPLGMTSYQTLWTGNSVILPAFDIWCGVCPHPPAMNRKGEIFDVTAGTHRAVPHGPVDDLDATYVFTDGLLFGVNTQVFESGGGIEHRPGEAAVWDPVTRVWTSLPRAPHVSYDDPVVIATGSGVIVWGPLVNSDASGVQLHRG